MLSPSPLYPLSLSPTHTHTHTYILSPSHTSSHAHTHTLSLLPFSTFSSTRESHFGKQKEREKKFSQRSQWNPRRVYSLYDISWQTCLIAPFHSHSLSLSGLLSPRFLPLSRTLSFPISRVSLASPLAWFHCNRQLNGSRLGPISCFTSQAKALKLFVYPNDVSVEQTLLELGLMYRQLL